MIMSWEIKYYDDGKEKPVERFIDSTAPKAKAKILRNVQLLAEFGVAIGYPLVSNLDRNIWELRTVHQGNQYRILFSIVSGQIVLLTHAFQKKTRTVSNQDKELAKKKLKSYLEKGDI